MGDPIWQPLFANPNYPDYTSGANSLTGAATEMLRLFFRTDRVNFSMVGPTSSRFLTRFSDAASEVVEARMYMGIHFRFADTAARLSAMRVGRWAYKYFLRALVVGPAFAIGGELRRGPDRPGPDLRGS